MRGKLFFSGGPGNHAEAQAIGDELEALGRSKPEKRARSLLERALQDARELGLQSLFEEAERLLRYYPQ